jgi:hypothetical protein
MSKTFPLALVTAFLLFSAPALNAQVVRRPLAQRFPQERVHQEPCWKQVGISKAAIDERQAIARETRSQVEAVCVDSSLTPEQKRQRIREIRQQAKQRSESLISPQQQEELQACQKERAASHPASSGVHHAGGATGPCGELLTPAKPHPQASPGKPADEDRPNDEAPPQD